MPKTPEPVTPFGEKLRVAMGGTPAEQLARIAANKITAYPKSLPSQARALLHAIENNPALLLELFKPIAQQHAEQYLLSVAAQAAAGNAEGRWITAEKANQPVPPRPNPNRLSSVAIRGARAFETVSYLKSFIVNGKPVGDCTPAECRPWLAARHRDADFVARLISGVPDNMRIADAVTDDEAAALYRAAEKRNRYAE